MRTLRLVRELDASGWRVTVITSAVETYLPGTPVDRTLEAQVPKDVEVLRARVWRGFDALTRSLRPAGPKAAGAAPAAPRAPKGASSPSAIARAKDWMDAVLTIPDKESGWIVPATLKGIGAILSQRPDVIYSSAPPWSGQVVAWLIAACSGRPWVADFRDPWARAPGRVWGREFRGRAAAFFERRVVSRADAVLFVTRANVDEFTAVYGPALARRFLLVPNGCDPALFDGVDGEPSTEPFVLTHAGSLYGPRNPMPLIRAIGVAAARGDLTPSRFKLRLVGDNSLSVDLQGECRRLGIDGVVEFVPRVTRAESLRELKRASALLLVQTGTTVSIPGKAYEYLASGRPIFALSEEGETADLVRASGIGVSVSPDAPSEVIADALLKVVALGRVPHAVPPRVLYDGVAHARTAVELLAGFARDGRAHRVDDAGDRQRVSGAASAQERAR